MDSRVCKDNDCMLNPLAALDFTGLTISAVSFWFMLKARIPYLDV